MALAGKINVSTEELRSQAEEVRRHISTMRDYFNDMGDKVAGCTGYWNGEASDAHRDNYMSRIDKIESMLRRYDEHVTDLLNMAGVYEEAENKATSLADDLPMSEL